MYIHSNNGDMVIEYSTKEIGYSFHINIETGCGQLDVYFQVFGLFIGFYDVFPNLSKKIGNILNKLPTEVSIRFRDFGLGFFHQRFTKYNRTVIELGFYNKELKW
jgi:hypothetical protein